MPGQFAEELEKDDHRAYFPVSNERWQQIKHASADDPVLQQLHATICRVWPESKSEVPEFLYPYYDMHDMLTVQSELVFKGQLLVVPACLRKELMVVVHSSHIGIEGCIRRACQPSLRNTSPSATSVWHTAVHKPRNHSYNMKLWLDHGPRLELICANLTTAPS